MTRARYIGRCIIAYYKTLGIFGVGFLIGCGYGGFTIGMVR